MQEAFIHFVWKHQYFNKTDLQTTDGLPINILKPGNHNTDAGPDFKESKLLVDELKWSGSIEIHHRSSDWNAHQHQNDDAYNNVVLHIVWQHDKDIQRPDGTVIPTLEIKDRVDSELVNTYRKLIHSLEPIPCSHQLDRVDEIMLFSMLDRMKVERLDEKALGVNTILKKTGNDWEATAFRLLSRNFGFKTNAAAFERLAELVPAKLLVKHRGSQLHLEALLFGQAGFLEMEPRDAYHDQLKKEFGFLKHKYKLPEGMSEFQWKFLRLRPANFPTLRIAQLAAVMHNSTALFSRLKEAGNLIELKGIFQQPTSGYWKDHFRFGKKAEGQVNNLGNSSIQNIGINTVAPLLAAYAKSVDQPVFIEQAIKLLQSLNPESNRIIKVWKELNVKPTSSFESQGLIQLFNAYCSKKRCLSCNIGTGILKRK